LTVRRRPARMPGMDDLDRSIVRLLNGTGG
jgi:hypothetical protein